MSNDKDKLLQILASLESDYAHGKISREKYIYFRSKYEDRLNAIDAREATNRIRSMQGKPSDSPKKIKKPIKDDKKVEEDLVQKYIVNPKKGDKKIKEKSSMDSGTFKLVAILILAIGFTVGAGFGVFNFDFGSFSDSSAVAIVNDTAFPDVKEVHVNTTDVNGTYDNSSSSNIDYSDTTDGGSDSSSEGSHDEPTPEPSPPQQNPTQ
jgi:hypothetical protein